MDGKRLQVVGSAGAGKSTLGAALSACLRCPLVELDQLYWQPGWQPASPEAFRAAVAAALAGPQWVACGNYRVVRDLVWGRADTLIWLDYPLPLILYRLCRRTWQRIARQEELWGGNRESWRAQLCSRESLLLYTVRTHKRRQREITAMLDEAAYAHLAVQRFRRPAATSAWLAAECGA